MRQRWIIEGRVQGVGFRAWVARYARETGLRGWIRNRADGSVETEAEGEAAAMQELERRVKRGPPHASVQIARAVESESDELPLAFHIRRD
jgi:acylphosphatase